MVQEGQIDGSVASVRHRSRPKKLYTLAVVVFILAASIGIYGLYVARKSIVPPKIAARVTFPLYLPRKLPGSYKIDANSFDIQEEGVLVFRARDDSGAVIALTEQSRPKGMDFELFYKDQFQDAHTLTYTKYASVVGKTLNKQTSLLSVVTDKTWLLVSTNAPLDEHGLELIAQSLRQQ